MDLKHLNLVQLSTKEVEETEGGLIPFILIGMCLLLSSCVPCRANP